jgi:alkanesulfonate monooxygenase SsuD/methylene tetrahydromethanopterin reductase-like flavin-dependent oxidoreductase (luciferase family)
MRLGLGLPHYDTSYKNEPVSWDAVRRVALLAEASGFDSVWVSDHLFLDWGKYGGPGESQGSLECWTTLAALTASTSTIRLGSLTVCNDLRSPALLAKMAATLGLLGGNRLDLGMGAGWYEPEYRAAGIDFDGPGTRIRRHGDAVEIVTSLHDGDEVTFKSEGYTIDGAVCRPLPEPRPRVFVGGKGDLLLKTAARVADGWNYSWLGSIDDYAERSRAADRACEEQGRDPSTLARSVGAYVLAGSDDADAKRRFERLAERTPPGVLSGSTGSGAVSWDEFRKTRVAGTVDEVAERLRGLDDLGVEEVIVTLGALPFQLSDEEDIELIGAEIAPALR